MRQPVGGDPALDATDARGFSAVLGMLLSHVFAIFFWSDALSGKANGRRSKLSTAGAARCDHTEAAAFAVAAQSEWLRFACSPISDNSPPNAEPAGAKLEAVPAD